MADVDRHEKAAGMRERVQHSGKDPSVEAPATFGKVVKDRSCDLL